MFIYLLITILTLVYGHTQVQGELSRVIGGLEASYVFGKYQASLQNVTGHHVCGGAIISNQHIITAAHCVSGADPQYIKIVVGTNDLEIRGEQYDVASIQVYEEFDLTSKCHDIAVVKVTNSFAMEHIEILELNKNELHEGDSVVLTGFGALEANGLSSEKLHILLLSVFSQEICRYAMRYTKEVDDFMFCTFNMIGQGTCHGDSGSPLVRNNQLVGLVSWGIPCARGFPDVHTRITPYISWIQEQISS